MALISASIDLQFNANYTGCHRVCWRAPGVGSYPLYDCTIQVNCSGLGLPCTATIPIQVDDASCVPLTFDGYVQACCEDINSPNGKLPFTVTFTPDPLCKGYTITCIGPVGVASVIIINPGSGYIAGATIPVTISGGGGSGATANALIGNGGISTATITAPGAGYINGTYNNVPANTITGVGAGALFTVVVAGGAVFSATIVPGSNGVNYNPFDTFDFLPINIGGAGAGVLLSVTTVNTSQVQSITLTAPGSGYTSVASAVLSIGTSGIVAVLGVKMAKCSLIDIPTCGNPATTLQLPLGTSFVSCSTVPYQTPVDYTSTQDSCCSNCTSITFDKPVTLNNPQAFVYYEDCTTKVLTQLLITAGSTLGPFCAVTNSWFVIESDPVNGTTNIGVGLPC